MSAQTLIINQPIEKPWFAQGIVGGEKYTIPRGQTIFILQKTAEWPCLCTIEI